MKIDFKKHEKRFCAVLYGLMLCVGLWWVTKPEPANAGETIKKSHTPPYADGPYVFGLKERGDILCVYMSQGGRPALSCMQLRGRGD